MKKADDAGKASKTPEKPDGFDVRAKSILDRLDRVDHIFDNMESRKRPPDKSSDTFQEVCDSIERGFKKLFNSISDQVRELMNEKKQSESSVPKNLSQYLNSCSDEQLMKIKDEIDRLLKERRSV